MQANKTQTDERRKAKRKKTPANKCEKVQARKCATKYKGMQAGKKCWLRLELILSALRVRSSYYCTAAIYTKNHRYIVKMAFCRAFCGS